MTSNANHHHSERGADPFSCPPRAVLAAASIADTRARATSALRCSPYARYLASRRSSSRTSFWPAASPSCRSRILRKIESTDAVRYEIARESLVPILRDWWERHEGAIVSRRRARFRKMSIWLAFGAIAGGYILWLIFGR